LFACEINLDETPEAKSKTADAMMDSCDCPDDVAYVCSTIWETYQNLCQLECAGAALMSEGECMNGGAMIVQSLVMLVCMFVVLMVEPMEAIHVQVFVMV
jgi:hypothetical protein